MEFDMQTPNGMCLLKAHIREHDAEGVQEDADRKAIKNRGRSANIAADGEVRNAQQKAVKAEPDGAVNGRLLELENEAVRAPGV